MFRRLLNLWMPFFRPPRILFLLFGLKICVAGFFSSDFQDQLFIPFVRSFLEHTGNPWEYAQSVSLEFPYPPLMLYLLVPGMWLSDFFKPFGFGFFTQNLLFKLPQIVADFGIFYILFTWFRAHRNNILWIYALSPIVLYGVYLHSQLDLIPTALLLFSLYFLFEKKLRLASCVLAAAVLTKLHVLIAVPIVLMYVQKRFGLKHAIWFALPIPFFGLSLTYAYWSQAFMDLVILNPKQMQIAHSVLDIGTVRLYLPVLVIVLLYGWFFSYKQVNRDLLMAYLGIVFSVFVSLLLPAPGWYVWLVPFLSYFWIKFGDRPVYAWFFGGLHAVYLLYFVFFYIPDYVDLRFLGTALQYKIHALTLHDGVFTVLAAALVLVVAAFYRVGLKSNTLYANSGVTVIGIGGDSGSGKSRLKRSIRDLLGTQCIEMEGDGDHRWERGDSHWQKMTHLDPKANFLHRQAQDLLRLKQWKSVNRTDYDHQTGRFSMPVRISPSGYIVLSGLHPFYLPIMRRQIDLKIYLEPQESLRCLWKVRRDTTMRGYSVTDVLRQMDDRQCDSAKFIHPQKMFADMVIQFFSDSDFDPCHPDANPDIGLCVRMDASVPLDSLLDILSEADSAFSWDYDEDMRYQSLRLYAPISLPVLEKALADIDNVEDLCDEPVAFVSGYDGFIQVLILMYLAYKRKMGDAYVSN